MGTRLPPAVGPIRAWGFLRGGPKRLDVLDTLARECGDVFRLHVPLVPLNEFMVADAGFVGHVLQESQREYPKSPVYKVLRPLLGDGLLTAEGATWRRHRRLAQPAFHHEKLQAMTGAMVAEIEAMLARWDGACERGEPIDVAQEMWKLTLAVAARTLFGTDVSALAGDIGDAFAFVLREVDRRMSSPFQLPLAVPTPRNLRYRKAIAVLDAAVEAIIAPRRKASSPGDDLLGMLLAARDEETGKGLSPKELRDEVMTLILAGHETTSNALCWTFSLLSEHRQHANRLGEEAVQVLGSRAPGYGDVETLAFARRVLNESMRLYPPIWVIERVATVADEYGEWRIPKGAWVGLNIHSLHRNPRYWQEPERFDPDRFLPERSASRPKDAFIPFAVGPRMCIGSHFATIEATLALASVARRFRLVSVDGRRPVREAVLTLRPAGGVPMRLERVAAAAAGAPGAASSAG